MAIANITHPPIHIMVITEASMAAGTQNPWDSSLTSEATITIQPRAREATEVPTTLPQASSLTKTVLIVTTPVLTTAVAGQMEVRPGFLYPPHMIVWGLPGQVCFWIQEERQIPIKMESGIGIFKQGGG